MVLAEGRQWQWALGQVLVRQPVLNRCDIWCGLRQGQLQRLWLQLLSYVKISLDAKEAGKVIDGDVERLDHIRGVGAEMY